MDKRIAIIVGTGEGVNSLDLVKIRDNLQQSKGDVVVFAFQEAYPHMKIEPHYWFWSDPNSSMEGLQKIVNEGNGPRIMVPHFMADTFATFRMYCGTTPLGRQKGAWERYQWLLEQVESKQILQYKDCTTSKYLSVSPYENKEFSKIDWAGSEAQERFNSNKAVFGSVHFDSESVIGDKFKWGLESKLTSYALPLMAWIGFDEVYVCGFGMKGGRFFEPEKTRMPFNDETQTSSVYEFPLSIVKKWTQDWKPFHGLSIYSLESDEWSYLNTVMEKADETIIS
jgi:hypothetical protein